MKKKEHGGNIYKKSRETGIPIECFLDFSANINPLGLPGHVREAMIKAVDGTVNYPDPDCTDLVEAIASYEGLDPDCIICGNGGADLLYRLAYGLSPGKVLLPVPSFAEYEESMKAAGGQTVCYPMGQDLKIHEDFTDYITEEIDLVTICNPNNPTGLLTEREKILSFLDRAEKTGTVVLVDECFLEICRKEEEYTMIPYLPRYRNLVILKSFTKLYAIPGIRLGYILCSDPAVIEAVREAGQAWPVSTMAQAAGIAAMGDKSYKEQVKEIVGRELAYMKEELGKLPVRLYEGEANYLFFCAEGIDDLDERLLEKGILIRSCRNYENLGEDYYRVAVRKHEENLRLIGALKEIYERSVV